MQKYVLLTLIDQKIVANAELTHKAQDIYVEEALAEGLSLCEMLELDGFMDDWIPLVDEEGYGPGIETCESPLTFTVIKD